MKLAEANAGVNVSAQKKKSFWTVFNKYKYLYLLALPGITVTILFSYVPMYGLQLAFKDYSYSGGIWGSEWAGLKHFKFLVSNPDFLNALKNTIVISFGRLLFGFPAPIILALLLNELRNPVFKRTVQSILYLPHFLSWVIMTGIIFNILSLNTGVVNNLLESMGLPKIMFLGNPKTFRPLIYISDIWKNAGWGTIIYLAAIAGIDVEIYESAVIDGAGRFQQMIYITLPSMAYAIGTLLILSVGGMMNAGFDQIFNLMNPPTQQVGDIIDTYVYRLGVLSAQYDFSTAVGLFKNVVNCILMVTANWVVKLFGHEGFI